ncbi:hypothetical protein V5799_015759, partial [Amblyomma americanum]
CIMVGLFGKIYRPFALKWLRFMVADFAWDKDREVYIGATSLAQLGLSSFPDELFLAKHTTCGGYFQVTLPKSTEKCINETLKLCEAGQEVDKLFLEKFLFPVKVMSSSQLHDGPAPPSLIAWGTYVITRDWFKIID